MALMYRQAIFFILTLLACAFGRAEPSNNFSQASAILQRIAGAEVRLYSTRDFGRERFAGAVSALVDEKKAEGTLLAVRKELPAGFVAFIGTTRSLSTPPAVGVELVVGGGDGPLTILEIAKTDAVNYGMDTEKVKAKLARWHERYGIDIWQAETDTIQLRFSTMPADMKAFAEEVYEFCPDVVDQGVGTKAALIRDIVKTKGMYLWWD